MLVNSDDIKVLDCFKSCFLVSPFNCCLLAFGGNEGGVMINQYPPSTFYSFCSPNPHFKVCPIQESNPNMTLLAPGLLSKLTGPYPQVWAGKRQISDYVLIQKQKNKRVSKGYSACERELRWLYFQEAGEGSLPHPCSVLFSCTSSSDNSMQGNNYADTHS